MWLRIAILELFSLRAHYLENCFQNLIVTGVMCFGFMRAGPSWCLLDLDACRRSVGLDFDLSGAHSMRLF